MTKSGFKYLQNIDSEFWRWSDFYGHPSFSILGETVMDFRCRLLVSVLAQQQQAHCQASQK